MKLIVDWWNGGAWQWKYYDSRLALWFDYGSPFHTHQDAQRWMEQQ